MSCIFPMSSGRSVMMAMPRLSGEWCTVNHEWSIVNDERYMIKVECAERDGETRVVHSPVRLREPRKILIFREFGKHSKIQGSRPTQRVSAVTGESVVF